MNALDPRALGTSLAKIDFKALDKLMVKPIGVYGSKAEIVRFLTSIGVINEERWVYI
jgi:hypothetical protein